MRRILALATLAVVALLAAAACTATHIKTVTHTKTINGPAAASPAPAPAPQQPRYHTPYGTSAHSPTFGKPPIGVPVPPRLTAVPTLPMYDSTTVSALPAGSRVYAGYTSGWWPTAVPIAQRFPSARVITIAVNSSHTAQCLDVEPGDATASQAPGWFRADRAAGFTKPCIYASLSNWPSVRAALNAAGISRSSYFAWDADWTYSAHLDAGYDATQWTDHWNNRNVDASTITYAFAGLGVTPDVVTPDAKTCPAKAKAIRPVCLKLFPTQRFGKWKLNERNAVSTYKYHRAKSQHPHVVYLRNRVWYVAHHNPKGAKLAKPNWNWHRGYRYQRLARDAAGK